MSLQKILWTIAGAEIPILEQCRTDHKKYGAMGATIAMTSFIAFLSGTSAAWFFTQSGTETSGSIGWAMAFGLVWATLIFCIDRSLVITMKKNPGNKSKAWWVVPLLSRAALALIIAFMVSIPLELVVFEDFIAEQEYFWSENKSNTLAQNSRANRTAVEAGRLAEEGNDKLKHLDGQKTALEGNVANMEVQFAKEKSRLNHPTTQVYLNAQRGLQTANAKINSLRSQLSNAEQWQRSNINSNIKYWQSRKKNCTAEMKRETEKWNVHIRERMAELTESINAKKEEIASKAKQIDATQEQIIVASNRRNANIEKRDSLIEEHDRTMQQGNHFIQNFEILEYAVSSKEIVCNQCNGAKTIQDKQCANCHGEGKVWTDLPTEWYFLWLIRILFFIIELLPTVVKVVMPLGVYDRMLLAEEKNMENYLASNVYADHIRNMHDMRTKAHEEQLKAHNDAERDIRNKLIEKLRDAQLEVAEAAVRKWHEEELKKLAQPLPTHDPQETNE